MFVVLSHGQQFSERINSAKEEIEDRMLKFRECERETKTKAFSKEGLKQPSKQTPQDVTVGYVAQEQEKRQEVQEAFRRQISELTHEIEECECEINKEKARKRNQNQVAITRYETFIKHHHWHIKNLELVLRQIDNHIISPFDVSPILDGVADYIQNYRNPDFFFDDSVYEDFDLLSAPPASEPTSSDSDSDLSDSVFISLSHHSKNSDITTTSSVRSSTLVRASSTTTPPIPTSTPTVLPTPTPTPTPPPVAASPWKSIVTQSDE